MNSVAKGSNSFLQGTTTLGNSAINNVSDLISNSTSTIGNSVMKAANSMSNITNNIGKNVNSGIESMNDTFRNVVESTTTVLEKVPVLNSLITGSNGNTGSNKNVNNSSNGSNKNTSASSSGWLFGVGVFILLVCIFLFIISMFNTQIMIGINNLIATVRRAFGQSSPPLPPIADEAPVLPSAIPNADKPSDGMPSSIINKLLPTGRKEVFNVSDNEYTYYDAEPLCRALGAELATYSQVKEAWEKGADWCNYGWVKGQAAVYPTQSETWDKLQHGPADEKYACGNPGLNGGYFDNPEMRFGVSCYGQKPDQSSNDETMIMSRGGFPKTPATLKVDKQIQEYKDSLDTIGILPFNSDAWSN